MTNPDTNKEFNYEGRVYNGFFMLFVNIILIPAIIAAMFFLTSDMESILLWLGSLILVFLFFICLGGFFIQQPNQARVMIFFGNYRGTCRQTGFYWVNPPS